MSAAEIVLVAAAGIACGAINAVAGGGSLILFPSLLAVGIPTLDANVTNSVAAWPGYVGGAIGFRREIGDQRRRLTALALVTLVGSTTGCVLLLVTPDSAFDVVVPVLVIGASLLVAFQPLLTTWVKAKPVEPHEVRPATLVAIFLAMIYGGYFGGGIGVIVIGLLALTLPDALGRLNALKAGLSLVNATVSVAIFSLFGPVHWEAVAVAAPAALVGGFLGARVARRLDDRVLRICVVTFGLVVGAYLVVR
jgi:uncharacterized membrane protein YfcA